MRKKVLNILVVILTIGVIYEVYSYFNMGSNNKVLEDIKTVDIFDNKDKTLSIMIQDPTTFQYIEDTSRTAWPSRDEYMYAGTKCTDVNGTDLGDTKPYISFTETNPNPTVTITTKKTIYCTLYFAKGRPALEVLDKLGGVYYGSAGTTTGQGQQGNRQAVDELIRFKGTASQVTNNYICLGDENPDVCKTNSENMYRIIGVTTDGKLKVIKASPAPDKAGWTYNGGYNESWSTADARKYLNETFYNTINERIKGLIEYHTWNMEYRYGDRNYSWPEENPTSDSLKNGTVQDFVGLMYATDYPNAGPNVGNNLTNWLFIQNGWSGNIAEVEWTMTYGGSHSFYDHTRYNVSWYVSQYGAITCDFQGAYSIRPVFYLNTGNGSNVGLIGEGTTLIPLDSGQF